MPSSTGTCQRCAYAISKGANASDLAPKRYLAKCGRDIIARLGEHDFVPYRAGGETYRVLRCAEFNYCMENRFEWYDDCLDHACVDGWDFGWQIADLPPEPVLVIV